MTHTQRRGLSAGVIGLLVISTGCGGGEKPAETAASPTAPATPQIERVEPSSTAIDASFNVNPDGKSRLAVFGSAIPGNTTVLWNGQPLETSGGGTFVAAVVPETLYHAPGVASISLRTAGGAVSNTLDFTVYGKTGPEPQVAKLYPGTTQRGKGFNLQPDGQSAIGVEGENFLPGVTLLCDGRKLKTVFGKGTGLSAIVPADVTAKAGSHRFWAVNPDGKASNKVVFTVSD